MAGLYVMINIFRAFLSSVENNSLLFFQVTQRGVVFVFAILLPGLIGLPDYGRFSLLMVSTTSIAFVFSEATSITLVRYLALEKKVELNVRFLYLIAKMMFLGGVVSALATFTIWHIESSEFNYVLLLLCFFFSAALVANSSVVGISYGLNVGKKIGFYGVGMQLCLMASVLYAARLFPSGFNVFIIYTTSVMVFSVLFVAMFLRSASFKLVPVSTANEVNELGYILTVMAGMLLCAPIHVICLSILAVTKDGMHAVGTFNSLFVWYSIMTMLPSFIAPKLMFFFSRTQSLSEKKWYAALEGMAISTSFIFILFAVIIYIFICGVFDSYISFFDDGASILGLVLAAGVIAAACAMVTYWLYSKGLSSVVFKANLLYATLYLLGVCYFFYIKELDAKSMIAIIIFSSFIQFLFVFLIAKNQELKGNE